MRRGPEKHVRCDSWGNVIALVPISQRREGIVVVQKSEEGRSSASFFPWLASSTCIQFSCGCPQHQQQLPQHASYHTFFIETQWHLPDGYREIGWSNGPIFHIASRAMGMALILGDVIHQVSGTTGGFDGHDWHVLRSREAQKLRSWDPLLLPEALALSTSNFIPRSMADCIGEFRGWDQVDEFLAREGNVPEEGHRPPHSSAHANVYPIAVGHSSKHSLWGNRVATTADITASLRARPSLAVFGGNAASLRSTPQ
ncbi:hypothetical protein PG997_007705 [Apiospora hydei]|uniref:Uncharacterized protein n=1 Tax=Apiospora hydei TaxID=1337664 RepID=A0ABR1W8Z6_9PEZI